jgi:hypothetical protein
MTFLYDINNTEEKKYICFPPGEYEIEINDAVVKTSKKGNEMIQLKITAFDGTGKKVFLYDYIVNPSGLDKLKKICRMFNLPFTGELEERLLIGKKMLAKLKLEPASEQYGESNKILDYLSPLNAPQKQDENTVEKQSIIVDDDIPF